MTTMSELGHERPNCHRTGMPEAEGKADGIWQKADIAARMSLAGGTAEEIHDPPFRRE